MNRLILLANDRLPDGNYRIDTRRYQHVRKHLKLEEGDTLRAGLLNGPLGRARIESMNTAWMDVSFEGTHEPLPPLDIILVLALPRPPVLKRILADVTAIGIKHIVLLQSSKVEKSYWSTPDLHAELLHEKLLLGLEQAGDTKLPVLQLEKRFKPFVEDTLPSLGNNRLKLLAHPGDAPLLQGNQAAPQILAIGPEGGWTEYERDKLAATGFHCYSLGKRILRVETAVSVALGRLLTE